MSTNKKKLEKINLQLTKIEGIVKKYQCSFLESKYSTPTHIALFDKVFGNLQAARKCWEDVSPNPDIESDDKEEGTAYKDVTDKEQMKKDTISEAFKKGDGDKTDIHWNDVAQGAVGNCYLMASIGAIAKANPEVLRDLIDGPDDCGNYEVTLHIGEGDSKKEEKIVVTPEFLVDENNQPIYADKGDGELWVMLIEKAYAILRKKDLPSNKRVQDLPNGYGSLHNGLPEEALEALTGKDADGFLMKGVPEEEIKSIITDALNDKRAITSSIIDLDAEGEKLKLIKGHSYFILDFDGKEITLQNPHNNETIDGDGGGDITLSFEDYIKQYDHITFIKK